MNPQSRKYADLILLTTLAFAFIFLFALVTHAQPPASPLADKIVRAEQDLLSADITCVTQLKAYRESLRSPYENAWGQQLAMYREQMRDYKAGVTTVAPTEPVKPAPPAVDPKQIAQIYAARTKVFTTTLTTIIKLRKGVIAMADYTPTQIAADNAAFTAASSALTAPDTPHTTIADIPSDNKTGTKSELMYNYLEQLKNEASGQ
jgi:hypothetical protein